MIRRVPIACRKDWQFLLLKLCNTAVEDRNNLIARRHSKGATWKEIVLDIDEDESFLPRHILAR